MLKNDLRFYGVAGPQDFPSENLESNMISIKNIIKSGITAFQYRDKGTRWESPEQRIKFVNDLRLYAKDKHIPFIVNDDIKLALTVKADGIHVGQNDTSINLVKKQIPSSMWLGLSINKLSEIDNFSDKRVNYLGLGPIYPTNTKADAGNAIGTKQLDLYLKANHLKLPIIAIGGINLENMEILKSQGLDGIAVISLLTQSNDVNQTVKTMKSIWEDV